MSPRALLACLAPAVIFFSCQEGGTSKNAVSEVKQSVDHHMTAFGGRFQFDEGFPLEANASYTDEATLHFRDTGNYTLTRPGQSKLPEDKYFLSRDGSLTITVSQGSRSALRWPGHYDLKGDAYFFVSRSPTFLRAFFGIRQIADTPKLEGSWHVFGDTLVFADESQKPAPELVGRAFAGKLTFDAELAITSGSWRNSADRLVVVGGQADTNKLGFTDLSLKLTNGFAPGRTFSGGVANEVGVLVDRVTTGSKTDESNVGTLVMIRQTSAALDPKQITGKWRVFIHAVFPNPGQSGVDVATGTLELITGGTWKIELDQVRQAWNGTWVIEKNGALTITETGNNQAWAAAIDKDYRTIAIADHVLERTSNPFVGIFFGVRADPTD